jgi:hypothetical protein
MSSRIRKIVTHPLFVILCAIAAVATSIYFVFIDPDSFLFEGMNRDQTWDQK